MTVRPVAFSHCSGDYTAAAHAYLINHSFERIMLFMASLKGIHQQCH